MRSFSYLIGNIATMCRPILTSVLLISLAMLSGQASSQTWPEKSVLIICPFAAGAASDVVARVIASKLSVRLGQSVIVENKPGANAIIGTELAARAQPDGYTFLMGGTTTHAGNPSLFKTLPYDPVKDFAPVAYINGLQYYMVTSPESGVRTVKEFIAFGRSNPGKLSYATGNATGTIGAELFKAATGVEMVQISYKGPTLGLPDLISGRTSVMFADSGIVMASLSAGKLIALAIAAPERSKLYPEVPTLQEAGVPGVDLTVWNAMWAPAGTPDAIVQKMNGEINAVLALPEVVRAITDLGFTLQGGPGQTTADLGRFVDTEIKSWQRVVKQANIPQQ